MNFRTLFIIYIFIFTLPKLYAEAVDVNICNALTSFNTKNLSAINTDLKTSEGRFEMSSQILKHAMKGDIETSVKKNYSVRLQNEFKIRYLNASPALAFSIAVYLHNQNRGVDLTTEDVNIFFVRTKQALQNDSMNDINQLTMAKKIIENIALLPRVHSLNSRWFRNIT